MTDHTSAVSVGMYPQCSAIQVNGGLHPLLRKVCDGCEILMVLIGDGNAETVFDPVSVICLRHDHYSTI